MSWPENTAFSERLPALQLALDSTSLSAMKKCPRFFQLSHVEGWRGKRENIHFAFGIGLHSSRELYYHRRVEGWPHYEATSAALDWALTYTWDSVLERPKAVFAEDSYKNRFTLARTLVWYLDRWEHDVLETIILANGKPAVEVSFRFPLGVKASTGEDYLLCGHFDRAVEFGGKRWISDLKTTKNSLDAVYFAQFTPDVQMSTYSFAGKIVMDEPSAGIIIDAAQIGVGFSRFARGFVNRSQAQLDEWLRGVMVMLRQYETYASEGFWPMNERACFGCEFRGICSHSPQVREQWLKADFVKRVWNPLITRGDV